MRWIDKETGKVMPPAFNRRIITHPDRLSIPLKRRKPTVFAVWNDFYHQSVDYDFKGAAYQAMLACWQHIFLILTKRPENMLTFHKEESFDRTLTDPLPYKNVYHGLTICNQAEAAAKIPIFLQMPGCLFLSIEPMLGPIDLDATCGPSWCWRDGGIQCVILGGETGPGARPIKIEWVRSIRDQCQSAGVPFFLKSFGKYPPFGNYRLLDGVFHDELPWVKQ
jgi:protein gp37